MHTTRRTAPFRLLLIPLEGPVTSMADGVTVDLVLSPSFYISRFPRVNDATTNASVGEFEGTPCLYLKDRLVSHPNAVIVRENGGLRIKVAHDNVRNPLFINTDVLKPDAGVRDAELKIGDVVQIGTSRFRVDRASITQWAELFQRAYPDLTYVTVLQEGLSGRSRHQCESREGYRVDVECRTFKGPVSAHFRTSEETLQRTQALQAHIEDDRQLQPWVPRIYDVRSYELPDGTRHIFMAHEAYTGKTLGQLLAAGPLTREIVLRIGVRLCEAVHRLHQFNLHQQLMPDAVWFREGENPDADKLKLAGLMFVRETLSREGTPDAALAWTPPEFLDHGEYTERSDMYVVALLLAHALSGMPPYEGDKAQEVVSKVLNARPALPDSCPAKLAAVLDKAWAKRPSMRFRTLLDLKIQLQRLLEHG
ncbi:MAG: serine/threonine-protein kinase [Planctomycetota bacterium]